MGQSQKAFTALLFPLLSPHISLLSFVKVLGKTRQRRKMEKKGNTRGEQFFENIFAYIAIEEEGKRTFCKIFSNRAIQKTGHTDVLQTVALCCVRRKGGMQVFFGEASFHGI